MSPPDIAGSGVGALKSSRQDGIHVPGRGASSFNGCGVLHSLLRHLLTSRCRLGGFSRSLLAWQFAPCNSEATGNTDLFPMPLPYPEVFRDNAGSPRHDMALKKGVVAVVIVLNFLFLHRPKSFGDACGGQKRLSKRQWEAVRRMERFVRAWTEVSLITPEIMGRTSAKVESLETMLAELSECASALAKSGVDYFPAPNRPDKPGKVVAPPETKGKVQVSEKFSTFKQVDASRLSFVGRPEFDPTPYLDPLSRKIFNDPLSCRADPNSCPIKPPKLRVHSSREQKAKLFALLDASDRLRIHLPEEVVPLYGSGLFAVPKDLEKDRLILDSRGANLLESPPQRWIRSLGSAEVLCRISLEPEEMLVASGNDLRDFYYLFKATPARSRRNVLVGPMHPSELSHLNALKPHHHSAREVYGALGSLAMGDSQAVELAQSCHLGLGLQSNVVTADNLLTMYKPVPRTATMVGLVIDDFVALSKVPSACEGKKESEGAMRADKIQQAYEDVRLIPNKKKAFRDEVQSSFWGADVDGREGLVRGSLKRAIPLAGIILRLVKIGHCSGDLMQVIVGSVISLFLFRRRFLCLLDSCFESYRGLPMDEIYALSGRCKSDLLMVASLLPMAATNLRACCPTTVAACDASNWGEAGVFCRIPQQIGKELIRHTLRKSVWTRLLGPTQALLRSHGMLPEEEELPEQDDVFKCNPLWTCLAEALNYKLLFAKKKRGNRHINIGEVRAALRTEKLLALKHTSSRILLGSDSQVTLGSLVKGRSSSPAINEELSRSLPWMVALDSYLELMYYNTKVNRADDPTRGKEIAGAVSELPEWWSDLAAGKFQKFDIWLFEHGLDDQKLSGLPCFSELCGDVSPPGILPSYLQQEGTGDPAPERYEDAKSDERPAPNGSFDQGSELRVRPLPASTSPARLPRETVNSGRSQRRSPVPPSAQLLWGVSRN